MNNRGTLCTHVKGVHVDEDGDKTKIVESGCGPVSLNMGVGGTYSSKSPSTLISTVLMPSILLNERMTSVNAVKIPVPNPTHQAINEQQGSIRGKLVQVHTQRKELSQNHRSTHRAGQHTGTIESTQLQSQEAKTKMVRRKYLLTHQVGSK